MWERKWALLAWKLGSNGLVVDEGVVLRSVVDSSLGVYRTIQRGEETINIKHNIKHRKKYTANVKLGGTSAILNVTDGGETPMEHCTGSGHLTTDGPEGNVPRSVG